MRGEYDQQRKQFYPAEGEERRCVWEMYRHAGLISPSTPGITIPRATSKEQHSAPHASGGSVKPAPAAARSTPPADTSSVITRTAQARAALADAEGRVGMRPSSPAAPTSTVRTATQTTGALASDPQLGLIARLLNERRGTTDTASNQEAAGAIDALGIRFGISGLSRLRSKADLRGTHLSKANATKLIDALKALDGGTSAQAA